MGATAEPCTECFSHEAMFYSGLEEFVAGAARIAGLLLDATV